MHIATGPLSHLVKQSFSIKKKKKAKNRLDARTTQTTHTQANTRDGKTYSAPLRLTSPSLFPLCSSTILLRPSSHILTFPS